MSQDSHQRIVLHHANSTSGLAIAGLTFSILGWFTLGLLCIPGAFLCFLALFARGPKGVALAGMIVGFPGTLLFAFLGFGIVMGLLGLGVAATSAIADAERAPSILQTTTPHQTEIVPNEIESTAPNALESDSRESPDEFAHGTITAEQSVSKLAAIPFVQDQPAREEKVMHLTPSTIAVETEQKTDAEAAKWRTWTTADGKYKAEAKFVKMAMGTLTLEKVDGTTIDIQFDRLCSEDQAFVRQRKWRIPVSRVSGPSVKVVKARVVPYLAPDGRRTQMVLVDWRNTGTTTVRAVDADIIPYDANGNRLGSGATDYAIYAESDSSPGIAPGKRYTEPMGKGFILAPGFAEASRVEINITEVVESGAY
jgi:hypothetical protein